MSALEIKPGKYRTRDGQIVSVGLDMADPPQVIGRLNGAMMSWWSNGRASNQKETPIDLIERIEDEPKAEEKTVGVRKYEYVCGFDLSSGSDQTSVSTVPVAGKVIWASDRTDLADPKSNDFIAEFLSLMWRSRVAELEAKIARLEAENESLSRQLRSREINKEPTATGKRWRWSPMV